jgi:hypothetical protein
VFTDREWGCWNFYDVLRIFSSKKCSDLVFDYLKAWFL